MLKTFKSIIFATFILSSVGYAQSTYFNNTYDFYGTADIAFSVLSIDSGYVIAGPIFDTTNQFNVGILYIDNFGNEVWRKDYGQYWISEFAGWSGSLIPVAGGGYALAGSILWPSGDADIMLWRFDSNGDTLWTQTYVDTSVWAAGRACLQTPEGGFVIAGDVSNNLLLMKTDSLGNELWSNVYNTNHIGMSIDHSTDGGYVVGGGTAAPGIDDQSFVVKFDSSGATQWMNYYGGPLGEDGFIVRTTADGGYICAGDTSSALNIGLGDSTKIYLVKLDSSGNTEWSRLYGTFALEEQATGVRELSDGSFIVAGDDIGGSSSFGTYGALLKIGPSGDSLWMRYINVCDENSFSIHFRDVQQANDDGFIVCGFKAGNACSPSQDMWVVKTNCLGFDEPPQPTVTDSVTDVENKLISFINESRFSDSILIEFGDGNNQMIRNPTHTIRIVESNIVYDTVNFFTYAYPDTGTYTVTVTGWACGDTGVFTTNVTVPIFVGIENLGLNTGATLKAYPNPFSDYTTIEAIVPEGYASAKLVIYNMVGTTVFQAPVQNGFNKLTVSKDDLKDSGIYFYVLYGDDELLERDKMVIIE
ncbi:MAG: T9SS type A sorting domain-containing protein [Flavobacteriales bacterium]|nr:T9SS type A sorting domain-containing protein [Flavobacteriales bacterium]